MRKYINYGWKFTKGFKDSYLNRFPSHEVVDIPHAAIKTPLNCFSDDLYQGVFTYEKTFDYELGENKKHFIVFEGAMVQIHVYFNGIDYGEHISSFVQVRIDVSDSIKAKGNKLVVILDSREDPHIPPYGNVLDYTTFSGIYRPVYVESFKDNYIKDIFAFGDMNGNLYIEKEIEGKGELSYQLFYGGRLVKEFKEDKTKIENPILYSIEEPNLYLLRAILRNGDEVSVFERRLGFRTARFTKDGFYLNERKVKLIGLNRHQTYPYVGCAMPKSMQEDDANILKFKLGVNIVRTSHYPQSEDFLNRCDELGLLVIDEIPGWQFISKDGVWRKNYLYFVDKMVRKERNHPSLIGYGLRIDESPDDDILYSKGNEIAHNLDPYRQTLGVRNFKESNLLEDVYAFNDFSCCSLDHGADNPKTWVGAGDAPKIISEHDGHMFPTKMFDRNEKTTEHALRHLKVINDALGYEEISAVIGWCAFDYNTHKQFGSGDHICYHGVADIFRTPKAAGYAYLSQTSSTPMMWVANVPTPGDGNEGINGPITVFTNCEYVELFKGDKSIGKFYPDTESYPNLKHAPIIIDDFIGDDLNDLPFSDKEKKIFAKIASKAIQIGMIHLDSSDQSALEKLIKKYKFTHEQVVALYSRFAIFQSDIVWRIVGYYNGSKVSEKRFGLSDKYSYRIDTSADTLTNGDTYDVMRINVKLVDEYGTQAIYANRTIHIETQGPIALLSPAYTTLQGGSTAVYVRSLPTSESTYARIIIHFEDAPDKNIDIFVI